MMQPSIGDLFDADQTECCFQGVFVTLQETLFLRCNALLSIKVLSFCVMLNRAPPCKCTGGFFVSGE